VLRREREAPAVAALEGRRLAVGAGALPDRADGVDDEAGGQVAGGRDDGVAGGQPVRQPVADLRWMAPSTPPPPSSVAFAALTMAQVACSVMSPCVSTSRVPLMSFSMRSSWFPAES
jgi:hypothetical protein